MESNHRITLSVSDEKKDNRHFSLRLKQNFIIEPDVFDKAEKILAISDIEGNFMRFLGFLLNNKVVDTHLRWIFGKGHLIIAGDCFDRGEQVVECLWLIYSLEEKARAAGGHVHFILGNHEIMNMNGDWRYVHPKYARTTKTEFTALYYGNNELWRWLRTKNIIEKIGDILFVHGGISPELLQLKLSISEINERVRPFYAEASQTYSDPLLSLVFNSENSPFWYRGFYEPGFDPYLLDSILAHFNVKTIVTGHTMLEQVTPFFDNKIINIDTNHADTVSEALYINKNSFFRVKSNRIREKIK